MKKNILFALYTVLCLSSCGQNKVKSKQILKQFYENGKLKSISEIENNMKNGKETLYYENGFIMAIQYFKDDMFIDSFYHFSNKDSGKVILKGISKSISRNYIYTDRNLIYGVVDYKKMAESEGIAKTFYPNGNVFSISEYKNNKQDGVDIVYYENGQVKKVTHYKEGKEIPPIISFDTLGNIIRKR